MKHTCPYATRKPGSASLYCKLLVEANKPFPYCAHQYLCRITNRWENTEMSRDCPVRPDIIECDHTRA